MRSRFDPFVRGVIVGAVSAGATVTDAARHADVPVDTVKHWLKRGRREDGTAYAEFVEAVEAARMEPLSEDELVASLWQRGREGSVQALVFLLRRLDRELRRPSREADPLSELDAMTEGSVVASLAARRERAA